MATRSARQSRGGPRPERLLLATVVPAAVIVLAALVYSWVGGHGMIDTLVDPAGVFGYGIRWGSLSHFGVMTWTAAAAVALTGATDERLFPPLRRWLLRAGLATLVLSVDDVLMVHERLGWRVPGGEIVVLGVLGLSLLVMLLPGVTVLRRHRYRMLILTAVTLLATSVAVDAGEAYVSRTLAVPQEGLIVIEELFKLLGIAAWLAAVIGLTRVQGPGTLDHDLE